MRLWLKAHQLGISFLPVHVHSHMEGVSHPRAQALNARADAVTLHFIAPGGSRGDRITSRGCLALAAVVEESWNDSRFCRRLTDFVPPSFLTPAATGPSEGPLGASLAVGIPVPADDPPTRQAWWQGLTLTQRVTVLTHRVQAMERLHLRHPSEHWEAGIRRDRNHLVALDKLLKRLHPAPWDWDDSEGEDDLLDQHLAHSTPPWSQGMASHPGEQEGPDLRSTTLQDVAMDSQEEVGAAVPMPSSPSGDSLDDTAPEEDVPDLLPFYRPGALAFSHIPVWGWIRGDIPTFPDAICSATTLFHHLLFRTNVPQSLHALGAEGVGPQVSEQTGNEWGFHDLESWVLWCIYQAIILGDPLVIAGSQQIPSPFRAPGGKFLWDAYLKLFSPSSVTDPAIAVFRPPGADRPMVLTELDKRVWFGNDRDLCPAEPARILPAQIARKTYVQSWIYRVVRAARFVRPSSTSPRRLFEAKIAKLVGAGIARRQVPILCGLVGHHAELHPRNWWSWLSLIGLRTGTLRHRAAGARRSWYGQAKACNARVRAGLPTRRRNRVKQSPLFQIPKRRYPVPPPRVGPCRLCGYGLEDSLQHVLDFGSLLPVDLLASLDLPASSGGPDSDEEDADGTPGLRRGVCPFLINPMAREYSRRRLRLPTQVTVARFLGLGGPKSERVASLHLCYQLHNIIAQEQALPSGPLGPTPARVLTVARRGRSTPYRLTQRRKDYVNLRDRNKTALHNEIKARAFEELAYGMILCEWWGPWDLTDPFDKDLWQRLQRTADERGWEMECYDVAGVRHTGIVGTRRALTEMVEWLCLEVGPTAAVPIKAVSIEVLDRLAYSLVFPRSDGKCRFCLEDWGGRRTARESHELQCTERPWQQIVVGQDRAKSYYKRQAALAKQAEEKKSGKFACCGTSQRRRRSAVSLLEGVLRWICH